MTDHNKERHGGGKIMITRRLLLGSALAVGFAFPAYADTLNILMEGVPDTEFVKQVLPEFEAATGHKVNLEVVNYAEMHTKLVPQLVAPKGSYSVIVVDFYWVGEFIKAGWLQPLDERIAEMLSSGKDQYHYTFGGLIGVHPKVDFSAAVDWASRSTLVSAPNRRRT